MRYIKYAYEINLQDVKPIDLSEKGRYNILKGHFLELVFQQMMSKFNGEVLEGKYFGQEKTIIAPRFMIADTRFAKGEKSDLFQIDVFGRLHSVEKVWLCECKYRNTKMNLEKTWHHSGFNVHCGNSVNFSDADAVERLARYIVRVPISQERMNYIPDKNSKNAAWKVVYEGKTTKRIETFSAPDF